MRASIEAIAHSTTKKLLGGVSSIQMAADAANLALERAQASYDDVDVFINVGVYRDENICEPAIAALIQEKMGATTREQPVFSFDLANGGCGLVNAFQVVDSLVRAGTIRRALVVASDVDPNPRHSVGLELEPAGLGVVIGSDDEVGFEAFHAETFEEYAGSYDSHLRWIGAANPVQKVLSTGTQRIELEKSSAFPAQAADCAFASVERFLEDQDLTFDDLDLVVAPGVPEGLAERFVERAGVSPERLVVADGPLARAHTAGPGLSLEAAMESGQFADAGRTLLLTAGAGITVASALYRR